MQQLPVSLMMGTSPASTHGYIVFIRQWSSLFASLLFLLQVDLCFFVDKKPEILSTNSDSLAKPPGFQTKWRSLMH